MTKTKTQFIQAIKQAIEKGSIISNTGTNKRMFFETNKR